MVLNAAVQMLREADELKLKITKSKSGTSMLQERNLWAMQQQLQKIYQKVLVLDLDYALDKKVEQDLWNIGFKQQIEALQAISKDRKNPRRSEGQAMLSWVLQAAAGFYLCLLHQICTTFKLDLPFRRRASLLGWVEGWGAGEGTVGARLPPPAAARYICQHCLVHLGDLARYRQQLRVAHTFYRHALVVSAHSGQPYNQLALVSWRRGRRLGAVYWHVRSLLVRAPFPPAQANLERTLRAARHNHTTTYRYYTYQPLYVQPAGASVVAVYWHVRSLLVRAPFPPAQANLERTLRAARHNHTTTYRYYTYQPLYVQPAGASVVAVYWHVRSLLVRAPFPPAQANLERTLRAARHNHTTTYRYYTYQPLYVQPAGASVVAVYWHVRSLLVRAPFPPAQANLERTLRAARHNHTTTYRYYTYQPLYVQPAGASVVAVYWHVRSLLVRAPFPPAQANLERTLRAARHNHTTTYRYYTYQPLYVQPAGASVVAVYWHVRSLLVRAPFPPAQANLERTLRAARHNHTTTYRDNKDLPVLPGVTDDVEYTTAPQTSRLDAHSYVTELLRALHLIHNLEELETAKSLVNSLNSSLSALVATDSFESMTLIKMACVLIWLVHSTTEDMSVESTALSEAEAIAAALSESLATAALLALLLPQYTADVPHQRPLPAVRVWLQWVVSHGRAVRSAMWARQPALWPALAHTLNMLADVAAPTTTHCYEHVPLSEDEELLGFVPLEQAHASLQFPAQAAATPDDYTERDTLAPSDITWTCLSNEPELEHKVRSHRLIQLGKQLADLNNEHFSYTEEENRTKFTAASVGGEQLSIALAELCAQAQAQAQAGEGEGEGDGREGGDLERDDDSDDEPKCHKPPNVISEADFREKVREKRVGILKPQGSLERAREERALATQDELEPEYYEESKADVKEFRKPRVNIAMAAIMRKQEETNKQVKFVTPPPTPDSIADSTEAKDDKPKVIQPKPIKSLANLPIGRKTGGILSLKDKSGYPHLVNTDPEPNKKVEKEEKKEPKPSQPSQNSQQSYQSKRQEHQPSPNWGPTIPTQNPYVEPPRMNFQKTYGIQNTGISYNPSYQPNVNNQGIRLPVVNPKEIDVRTAALQKQNSRQDMFQESPKFGNHGYQISGDKKNFLNDLPPRFANQYRYWQNAQENQFNDNKFRDDKPNSLFNAQPRSSWMNTPQIPEYQQQIPWWQPPENPPNFNANYTPMNVQPNYFSPNLSNPYQNVQNVAYNAIPNQNIGQNKPENVINQPNYLQSAIGQPQMQNLQNIVASPNFNSSLSNFSYPPVGYDSSMYPQFGKLGYQPMQMKMLDKPQVGYQGNKDLMEMGLNFGPNVRNMNFNEPVNNDMAAMKNLDQIAQSSEGAGAGSASGNTYSLFSGAPDNAAWGAQRLPHQSLWSGPGPSPLERLLEQQKQMKQPPPPQ